MCVVCSTHAHHSAGGAVGLFAWAEVIIRGIFDAKSRLQGTCGGLAVYGDLALVR